MPKHNPPHPGKVVLDQCLKPLGLSITRAAQGLGVTRYTLSRLVNGKAAISPDMALRLSLAFGSKPEMWLRLQSTYDLAQIEHQRHTLQVERFVTS